MTERYDAAIIGAGADGLAAAALLAGAGLRVIVCERQAATGGPLTTRAVHPGFFASPFADTTAPIPDTLFRRLDLARHGAVFARQPPNRLAAEAGRRRALALAEAACLAPPPARWNIFARPAAPRWPPESWTHAALADIAAAHLPDPQEAAQAVVETLAGRTADPLAAGSALHLLAAHAEGTWRGGLGGLGAALAASAREAGAELATGHDVTDIPCEKGRATGVLLADGRAIAARAVLSTLDLKRTFLSLFRWNTLPRPVIARIGQFRIAGGTARLLLALSTPPKEAGRAPIHLADPRCMLEAHAAWRGSVLAAELPLVVRVPSRTDPALAPPGAAVMTVSIAGVPHTPFDGAWNHDKRERLAAQVLKTLESVFPGLAGTILARELLVPPDFEEALGATAGDLDGGELTPDQMFAFRPGFAMRAPRTPVAGLYLAGPSAPAAPFAACAAGAIAADAILADLKGGARA